LGWLRSLAAPDWQAGYELPWGRLNPGDLLACWAAHDLLPPYGGDEALHLCLLVELRYTWLAQAARPFDPRYAGEW